MSQPMKRTFDFSAALFGFIVTLPILALVMIAIRWTSAGPAIFAQTRVGRDKKLFTCYKLRTMVVNTGDHPSHEVGQSQITPLGAFLRKSKLDELPQLVNVLAGSMSLVGPRPCLPSQIELIACRERESVFTVRPGITGLAQIMNIDMSEPQKLAALDGRYVREQTFMSDLRILAATVVGSGMGVDRTASSNSKAPTA
jgi:O-antigen biosynthesis protein WbqP